jgi:predicted RNase H-like nuclease (RuvC/YqgF family)
LRHSNQDLERELTQLKAYVSAWNIKIESMEFKGNTISHFESKLNCKENAVQMEELMAKLHEYECIIEELEQEKSCALEEIDEMK